jgi:DNA primase
MPLIPDEIIDRIRESTDIVDVVSEYVQLKKAGRNFVGLCPFHNENSPSFSVNPDLQIYKCFGCGVGGPVFKFIQEIDHVSFVEAVTFLAERLGIEIPKGPQDKQQNEFHDQLYQANELALKYFHHLLQNDQRGRDALDYLRSRDVADETIERFGLGYAPSKWDGLLKVAGQRQLPPGIMERAGLALPGKRGHYDRFRDRLTFPISNLSGRTIGFGARALRADQEPKYLNSPESPIYHKSSVLYGLHADREAIRKSGTALVVEGYMDLIMLVQHGIDNVVASSGTALTAEQCRGLGRYAQEIVLLFDGDAAGSSAALRGVETILGAGLEAKVVSLPAGQDPDSYVREFGRESLEQAIATAGTALGFYLGQLSRQHDLTTVSGKTRAAEAIKPLLMRCTDAVRRNLMLREAAQSLDIDEPALRQELQESLRTDRPRRRPEPEQQTAPPAAPAPYPERQFIGLLLKQPRFIAATSEHLTSEAFTDRRTQEAYRAMIESASAGREFDLGSLIDGTADESLNQFLSSCAMEGFDLSQADQQWQDSVRFFRREVLSKRIDQTRTELKRAVDSGDEQTATRIIEMLTRQEKERTALGVT